jgi:hypothetical protein
MHHYETLKIMLKSPNIDFSKEGEEQQEQNFLL